MSLYLPAALADWGTPGFHATLKRELEALAPDALPLQQGVAHGGLADGTDVAVSVFGTRDDALAIHAEVGVFYSEIIAGCSCGDDPMPLPAYCVMRFSIDKHSAQTAISILRD
ncbi:MAG: hypothetical protein R6W97_11035 [Thiobacillus sp.]